jgi:hypothetical protein
MKLFTGNESDTCYKNNAGKPWKKPYVCTQNMRQKMRKRKMKRRRKGERKKATKK